MRHRSRFTRVPKPHISRPVQNPAISPANFPKGYSIAVDLVIEADVPRKKNSTILCLALGSSSNRHLAKPRLQTSLQCWSQFASRVPRHGTPAHRCIWRGESSSPTRGPTPRYSRGLHVIGREVHVAERYWTAVRPGCSQSGRPALPPEHWPPCPSEPVDQEFDPGRGSCPPGRAMRGEAPRIGAVHGQARRPTSRRG